jgi:hypothetical protein
MPLALEHANTVMRSLLDLCPGADFSFCETSVFYGKAPGHLNS